MFVQDERNMLNTEIFLPVLIEVVDDLKFEILTVEDISTLQKSLDEVKGDAVIIDDANESNDDDDSTFQPSTISITVSKAIDLDEVKGDVESLDEGDNDNDNDDKRNDKDHNYDKKVAMTVILMLTMRLLIQEKII